MGEIIDIRQCKSGPTPPDIPRTLEMEFGTVEGARATLERLAAAFANGTVSEGQARALVYIYNSVLTALKLEKEFNDFDDFKEKLEEIERRNKDESNRN